jgi:hypothetical protein
MQLELSEDQRAELIDLLQIVHADINSEIHHAMDHNYREKLRARRALVEDMLGKLGAGVQVVR